MTAGTTPFRFGQDSDGNYGYIITDEEGADTVVPFKTMEMISIPFASSIDVKNMLLTAAS